MLMQKLTTEEIVASLRGCSADEMDCKNCVAGWQSRAQCFNTLRLYAADRLEVLEAALGCDKRQVLLLPCKIGDPIWWVVTRHEYPHKAKTKYIMCSELYWHNLERVLKEYGKTVFTSKEEAMAAMEGAKADG